MRPAGPVKTGRRSEARRDGALGAVFRPAWRQGSWRGVSCHHKSHMALDSEVQREYASPISGKREKVMCVVPLEATSDVTL